MYPAVFDYVAPTSVEETLAILAEGGEDVKVLAGGQSLIPLMKLRLATPTKLVDINRVPGLDSIEVVDGRLRVGALARHNAIASSDVVKAENSHHGRGGAVDLRSPGPQRRHHRWLTGARRPAG